MPHSIVTIMTCLIARVRVFDASLIMATPIAPQVVDPRWPLQANRVGKNPETMLAQWPGMVSEFVRPGWPLQAHRVDKNPGTMLGQWPRLGFRICFRSGWAMPTGMNTS